MKFKIIATIVIIVVLLFSLLVGMAIRNNATPVDADGNPITTEQTQ